MSVRTRPSALALLVVLAGTVVSLQAYRDRYAVVPETPARLLYIRSPAVMSRLVMSYDAVAADLYWIRAIQEFGGLRRSPSPAASGTLLFPLLTLATSLDPDFSAAYRIGAFLLSEPAPSGAGRPDLAVALLEQGMAARPARWEYPYDVGFVYFRYADHARAAEWFARASRVPGSPEWIGPLVATTLAAGGQVRAARVIWEQLRASADQPWLQAIAEARLRELDATGAIAPAPSGGEPR